MIPTLLTLAGLAVLYAIGCALTWPRRKRRQELFEERAVLLWLGTGPRNWQQLAYVTGLPEARLRTTVHRLWDQRLLLSRHDNRGRETFRLRVEPRQPQPEWDSERP